MSPGPKVCRNESPTIESRFRLASSALEIEPFRGRRYKTSSFNDFQKNKEIESETLNRCLESAW